MKIDSAVPEITLTAVAYILWRIAMVLSMSIKPPISWHQLSFINL